MKIIEDKHMVDHPTIEKYDQINGFDVIEELFLSKGEDRTCHDLRIDFKDLQESAIFLYGLKLNPTTKLYVSFYLNRFYKREGILTDAGRVKCPVWLYDKCKSINNKYRNRV